MPAQKDEVLLSCDTLGGESETAKGVRTWTDSGWGASSVSGSAGVLMPARRIKLPNTMYGRKVAPVALPNNTNPGAPMAPNLPACRHARML